MNVSQALDDIKAFLENDPLVQAAVGVVLPPGSREVVAGIVHALEAEFGRTNIAAAEAARADERLNTQPLEGPQ